MSALVLDFDGVVFDSAPEAYLVARRTYADVGPAVPVESPLSGPSEISEVSRAEVLTDPIFEAFVERMPLGNRAEDYAVILSTLERGLVVDDQEHYDEERQRLSPEYADAFHARFYEVRARFRQEHPERWRALQGPYPEFVDLLQRRASEVTLAMATAKDRGSVRLLLEDHGLGGLFPDARLMDKETGRSKTAHLQHLQAALGMPFPEMTFVDDKVNHLDAVATLRVRCVLAAWGYNSPREHHLARRRGYLVCDLDTAEQVLFGTTTS